MQQIEAFIDPFRMKEVRSALEDMGIEDYMESTIRCHQKGRAMIFRGATFMATIVEKVKLEIIAADETVAGIIDAISTATQAGKSGECRFAVHPYLTVP